MKETVVSYAEMKDHLSAPAQSVVEAFMEAAQSPEDVLRHLVFDEGCDLPEAYGYVREVLSRSLMELTGASFAPTLAWKTGSAG
jgi:hypothetical protein